MAFSVSVKAEGESVVMQVLSKISGFNKSELFGEIGSQLVTATQLRFANQHDVDGNPWKQSWRANMQGGQTLRNTGRLMNSITHNVLSNGVEVGTNVEYAPMVEYGISRKIAKPFLFPAYFEGVAKLKERLQKIVE